jgi:hypothetical protein
MHFMNFAGRSDFEEESFKLIFDSWEATKKFRSHKINNLRPKKEIFP